MTTDDRRGQVPTAEEFFTHCLFLAKLNNDSHSRAAALHDEAQRVLEDLQGAYERSQTELLKIAALYAPERVAQASAKAKTLVDGFEKHIGQLTSKVTKAASETSKAFAKRALVTTGICGVFLIALIAFALWWIPSIETIKARRAEVAALEKRTGQLDKIKDCDGRLCAAVDTTPTQYTDPATGQPLYFLK